jgi:hypothetical protein
VKGRNGLLQKQIRTALALIALVALLSGCLYPQEMRKENQFTASESLLIVQNAIDKYKEATGVLPIKNSEMDTPIYEKYVIDMKKLTNGYLGQVPGVGYESGGTALFVLINVEQKPEVKLLDITVQQQAADIQRAVTDYVRANKGVVPKGEPVGEDVYRLDFSKLGKKAVQAKSTYSRTYLSYLVSVNGTVAIDYAADIMQAMERKGMKSADPQLDLRTLLAADSPYVPAKSLPYYWAGGEPKASAAAK